MAGARRTTVNVFKGLLTALEEEEEAGLNTSVGGAAAEIKEATECTATPLTICHSHLKSKAGVTAALHELELCRRRRRCCDDIPC